MYEAADRARQLGPLLQPGVGAAGSIRPRSRSSLQKPGGMGAMNEATFWRTSLGRAAPGMIETTAGWASGNCSAADGAAQSDANRGRITSPLATRLSETARLKRPLLEAKWCRHSAAANEN